MISNIQLLRALAAMGVVVYHTGFPILGTQTEFNGVALFFCISGFIMVHVTRDEHAGFFGSRVARIVPMYWLFTLVCFFWSNLGLFNPMRVWPLLWSFALHEPAQLVEWARQNHGVNPTSALEVAKSLLFIPYQNAGGQAQPVLGVGWSLNMEMFFYALFAIALKVSRRWAPLMVASALVLVRVAGASSEGTALAFYGRTYTDFFVWGICCWYAWSAVRSATYEAHRLPIMVGSALVAAAYLWASVRPGLLASLLGLGDFGQYAVYEAGPPLLLLSAVALHSAGVRIRAGFWLLLGSASYVMYLTHVFVMETARVAATQLPWADTARSLPAFAAAVAASLLIAVAVHLWIERPVARLLRRRSAPAAAGSAASPGAARPTAA